MSRISKKRKTRVAAVDSTKRYSLAEAVKIVKTGATSKFDETLDIVMNLGIDPKQSDQQVRGMVSMPNGTGKTIRVAVFARGDKAADAQKAGADFVGGDDLADKINGGFTGFDRVIATPDMMGVVGKLGKVLGPKGLMPNPKVGTVNADVVTAVKNAKAGQVQYRRDKGGIVQCTIGRASFQPEQLKTNLLALIEALNKAKPAGTKGIYMKKISISSTMGAGVRIDHTTLTQGQPTA